MDQTTITNVDPCNEKFGDPWFRLKICCYCTDINVCHIFSVGRDSVVGTATRYRLDVPGIESLWEARFPHPSRPTQGLTQPPTQWLPGLFLGVKRPGRGVDHPTHLEPRLKKD